MLRLVLALAAASVIAAPIAAAPKAKSCRDAKGHFTPCAKSAAAPAVATVTKDKNGKCHFAGGPNKGKFTKCP